MTASTGTDFRARSAGIIAVSSKITAIPALGSKRPESGSARIRQRWRRENETVRGAVTTRRHPVKHAGYGRHSPRLLGGSSTVGKTRKTGASAGRRTRFGNVRRHQHVVDVDRGHHLVEDS